MEIQYHGDEHGWYPHRSWSMVVLPGETALQAEPYTDEWDEGFDELLRQRGRTLTFNRFLACSVPQNLRVFSPSWAAYSAIEAELNAIGWNDAHSDRRRSSWTRSSAGCGVGVGR